MGSDKIGIKFGERNREYDEERPQYLAEKLLLRGNFKVLDCGSGLGEFSVIMRDKGYNVTCIDGNGAFAEVTRAKGFESYQCDFEKEKLPFKDNTFDGIVCLDVIEHIWDTRAFLKEIKRILKYDGWFISSTPNYSFWRYRMKHLFGTLYSTPDSRHKRFYSFKSFSKILTDNNFEINDWFVISNIPKIKKRFIIKILPNFLGFQILIRSKKNWS